MSTIGRAECSVPGCGGWVVARGLCNTHYRVQRRTGTLPDFMRVSAPRTRKALLFMGQKFESRSDLAKKFPAFGTDDAIRAISTGATTPMQVELACWVQRNRGYLKARQAVERSKMQFGMGSVARKPRRRKAA